MIGEFLLKRGFLFLALLLCLFNYIKVVRFLLRIGYFLLPNKNSESILLEIYAVLTH